MVVVAGAGVGVQGIRNAEIVDKNANGIVDRANQGIVDRLIEELLANKRFLSLVRGADGAPGQPGVPGLNGLAGKDAFDREKYLASNGRCYFAFALNPIEGFPLLSNLATELQDLSEDCKTHLTISILGSEVYDEKILDSQQKVPEINGNTIKNLGINSLTIKSEKLVLTGSVSIGEVEIVADEVFQGVGNFGYLDLSKARLFHAGWPNFTYAQINIKNLPHGKLTSPGSLVINVKGGGSLENSIIEIGTLQGGSFLNVFQQPIRNQELVGYSPCVFKNLKINYFSEIYCGGAICGF